MKLLHISSLCFLLCLSYTIAAETVDDPNKHKTTSTTTQAPTTPSTSEPSTSTPAPTTAASTTASTTISTSTTTPSTTTTTTPQPTTTSQAPTPSPTTSPSTTTPPTSSTTPPPFWKDDWVVINPKTNNPCIVASMNITFKLHANISEDFKITRSNATAEGGSCGTTNSNSTQSLRLVWPLGKMNSSFIITFTEKDKNFFISGLNLSLAYNIANVTKIADFSQVNLTLFGTSVNSSYFCDSAEFPKLNNNQNETVDIQVSALWIEAFKTGNPTSFSQKHYCPGEVPDIVPLVVGICLAGLVLVVVIAYLIGRRRSQASGYLSM